MKKHFFLSILMILTSFMAVNAQELLSNPQFDNWTEGLPDDWTAESGVNITQESETVYSADYSVGLEATGTSNRGIYQVVPVVAGASYEYSAYCYGLNGEHDLGLYVNWLDITGSTISGAGTFYSMSFGEWELVTSGIITAPESAVQARCRVRCYVNSAAGGYVDDVSFMLQSEIPTNTPAPPTATPEPSPTGPTPTPVPTSAIKINEVFINSDGPDTGCFIELYFRGGVSLDGYSLVGVNGYNGADYNEISLDGFAIPADGYFVIAQDDTVANYDLIDTRADYQNGPDSIQLRFGSTVVDAFGYGTFSGSAIFAGEGNPNPTDFSTAYSHSRLPNGVDTDDNDADFNAGITTAGMENEAVPASPTPEPTDTPEPSPTGPTPEPTDTPEPSVTPTPVEVYDIKINEVHINPDGIDVGCFVELYYAGSRRISLDGYTLVGINGNGGTPYNSIALTGTMDPGGFFVVAQDDTVANYDMIDTNVNYQNGPDSIRLLAGSQIVDAVGYGSFDAEDVFAGEGNPVAYPSGNHSLSRIPDGADTADNAVDFQPGELTSGETNVLYNPTPQPTDTPTEPTASPTPPCIHNGDVNNDTHVSSGDAQTAFQIALAIITPTYEEECRANCDGDGPVTAGDAQQIFRTGLGMANCFDPM